MVFFVIIIKHIKYVKKKNKECTSESQNADCTKCFLISVDKQWNPTSGRSTKLNCD